MGSTGVIWTARRFSLSSSSSTCLYYYYKYYYLYELEYLSDGDM